MNNRKELRTLTHLLKKVESNRHGIVSRRWFHLAVWVMCAVIFLILFQLFEHFQNTLILVIPSVIIGIFIGVISVIDAGQKSWPFLKPHISAESIRERINDLNT